MKYCYDNHLEVAGRGLVWIDDFGRLGAAVQTVDDASLARTFAAMGRAARDRGVDEIDLWISPVDPENFDDESSPATLAALRWTSDGPRLLAGAVLSERPDGVQIADDMHLMLSQRGLEVVSHQVDETEDGRYVAWLICTTPPRLRSVGDAIRLGEEVGELTEFCAAGAHSAEQTVELLRRGAWSALRGVRETDWLEVKRQHYQLDNAIGRIRLAGDVASLANAGGGLIVIGMKTRAVDRGDVIHAVNEAPLGDGIRKHYQSAVRSHVWPWPDGLDVEALRGDSPQSGLLVIRIPEQAESQRPFLVKGAVQSGRVIGTLVAVPTRKGEDTSWLTVEALHERLRRR